jgi:hypothetical protein
MVKPRIAAALALLFMTGCAIGSGLGAGTARAREVKRDSFARLAFRSLDLSDYKTTIHPVMPDSGITTGLVFVYGHPIPRPYRIELKDTLVFVNGMQVDPTPKTPEMLAREKARAESLPPLSAEAIARGESLRAVDRRMWQLYDTLLPLRGHAFAFDSVLRFLERNPHVDSVWRAGDRHLWVRYAGSRYPVLTPMPLTPGAQVDSNSRARLLIKASDTTPATLAVRNLVGALGGGRVVLFLPPLCRSVVDMTTVGAARVVLEDSGSSVEDKYVQLVRVIGGGDAKWLLANYSDAEWTWVGD